MDFFYIYFFPSTYYPTLNSRTIAFSAVIVPLYAGARKAGYGLTCISVPMNRDEGSGE